MWHRWVALAAALSALACGQSWAQADPLEDCNSSDVERMVTGCTMVLQTAATPEERLAAFARRGFARKSLGQCPAAIADLTSALEIVPQSAALLALRGQCQAEIDEPHAALADFDAALVLEPDNAELLEARTRLLPAGPDEPLWALAKDSANAKLLEAFIESYPASRHIATARVQLVALGGSSAAPPPVPSGDFAIGPFDRFGRTLLIIQLKGVLGEVRLQGVDIVKDPDLLKLAADSMASQPRDLRCRHTDRLTDGTPLYRCLVTPRDAKPPLADIPDSGRVDLALTLVRNGLLLASCDAPRSYADAEDDARQRKQALWSRVAVHPYSRRCAS